MSHHLRHLPLSNPKDINVENFGSEEALLARTCTLELQVRQVSQAGKLGFAGRKRHFLRHFRNGSAYQDEKQ